jgi:hypothetical protein
MQINDTGSFTNQVQFLLGVNPNGQQNIGKFMTVSKVSIGITNSNATRTISSDFTTGAPLDVASWNIVAEDPASIIVMPVNSIYRATWRNAVGAGVGQNTLQFTNALAGSADWAIVPPGALLGDGTNVVFVTKAYTTNAAGSFRVRIPYTP